MRQKYNDKSSDKSACSKWQCKCAYNNRLIHFTTQYFSLIRKCSTTQEVFLLFSIIWFMFKLCRCRFSSYKLTATQMKIQHSLKDIKGTWYVNVCRLYWNMHIRRIHTLCIIVYLFYFASLIFFFYWIWLFRNFYPKYNNNDIPVVMIFRIRLSYFTSFNFR